MCQNWESWAGDVGNPPFLGTEGAPGVLGSEGFSAFRGALYQAIALYEAPPVWERVRRGMSSACVGQDACHRAGGAAGGLYVAVS